MNRWIAPLLALAILLLNVFLNAPLFMSGELPFRGSIEGGYVSMARFLSEHPDPWGWNPLPYCGLPTQFMYVPGLLYTAAIGMRWLPQVPPDTVYRWIAGFLTCLGPVTLFVFALYFVRSRRWALAAALAYSLVSPSYLLFPAVEKDRGIVQLPWHIQVLAKYGEGPHDAALTLLPLALLAVWIAATGRGFRRIFGAAILLAAIPLTNWIGALVLAISSLLLLLAAWGETKFRASRALAAAALAYGLACFWLTPSFVRIIAFNWPADSFGYKLGDQQIWSLAAMGAGVLLLRFFFRWLRASFYFCLVTLGAFTFGWIATAWYVFGIDTLPESRRYAIEFELFLALAAMEALRLSLRSTNSTVRLCAMGTAGVMLLVSLPQLWAYTTQGWQPWSPAASESTVEFQLARWIALHSPHGRVFASGGLRFRLNSWFDIPQVGGGFETGLHNRVPVDTALRVRTAGDTTETLQRLKAVGAQYVVIHGPKSREYYRDFRHPERVVLPSVYRLEDDTIYALPGYPLAHLVRDGELAAEARDVSRYVAAIEDASRPPLNVHWPHASAISITGPVAAGDLVSLQVNADPGWQASQDGRPIAISQDGLGFLVLHPSPAAQSNIELRYRGTAEQRVMATFSALVWIAALLLAAKRR